MEESLLYCDKENGAPEKFKLAEKNAKANKKGLWSASLRNFEPVDPLELQKERFKGKFSWVEDG